MSMLTVKIYLSPNKDTFVIKLSELLEKLYNHEWLSDKEFETYLKLVENLKRKEKGIEGTKNEILN